MQPDGQAYALEGCVVCPLRDSVICQSSKDLLWDRFPTHEVIHLHGTIVDRDTEKKDIEIRRLCVLVCPALSDIHTAPGLEVYAQ